MSSTSTHPNSFASTASTASTVERPARARNRGIAALLTLAATLVLLVSPQLTGAAAASTHHTVRNAVTANHWAHNMLAVLNAERRAHHLRPLTMSRRLERSAHSHNVTMARADAMSHQLPGEAFFATRISKTGYNWRAAGENIGWNSRQTKHGLQLLERGMYNERAPYNGHRLNILSPAFRQVGINVYFDKAHHKMWFTQDFGTPA